MTGDIALVSGDLLAVIEMKVRKIKKLVMILGKRVERMSEIKYNLR
jgi:hypothetical protein